MVFARVVIGLFLLWPAMAPVTLGDSVFVASAASQTFSTSATLGETVSVAIQLHPHQVELDSYGSNVNALAALGGAGYARDVGSPQWAPREFEARALPVSPPAVGLFWSNGRLADFSDPLLEASVRCGPQALPTPVAVAVRSDAREVALLTHQGWDWARIADGALGDEAADWGHAKDVSVRVCGQSFTPDRLNAGQPAQAHFAFASLFPWGADGRRATVEYVGSPPTLSWRSWGPHDFVPGTPDDP